MSNETVHTQSDVLQEEPLLYPDEVVEASDPVQSDVETAAPTPAAEVEPVENSPAAEAEPVVRPVVHNLGGVAARSILFAGEQVKGAREAIQDFKARDKGEMLRSLFGKARQVGSAALKNIRTKITETQADFVSQMEGRPYEAVRKEMIARADSARRHKRVERQYWIDENVTELQLKAMELRELPGRTKDAATAKAQEIHAAATAKAHEVKSNVKSSYHEAHTAVHGKVSMHVGRVAARMSGLASRVQNVSEQHAQVADEHSRKAKAARGQNVYVQPRLFE